MIVLVILIGTLVLQWVNPSTMQNHPVGRMLQTKLCLSDSASVMAYFPTWVNATYQFAGEGLEFAAFTRQVTFATPGFLQIEDLSGTNLVKIVEVTPEEIRVVWSAEEFYEDRNLLEPSPGRRERLVLLKTPLEVGTSWSDDRFRREIVEVNKVVQVPLGTFCDVIVVKSEVLDASEGVQYEYYAKNMGLIRRESQYGREAESFTVISTLEKLTVGG